MARVFHIIKRCYYCPAATTLLHSIWRTIFQCTLCGRVRWTACQMGATVVKRKGWLFSTYRGVLGTPQAQTSLISFECALCAGRWAVFEKLFCIVLKVHSAQSVSVAIIRNGFIFLKINTTKGACLCVSSPSKGHMSWVVSETFKVVFYEVSIKKDNLRCSIPLV